MRMWKTFNRLFFHLSCYAVVDPNTMKVHGLENVRVVDASAMPYVTNGNIHAPVLMLAEKAADLILGRKPLDPIHADFYRHGVHPADAGTIATVTK